MNTVVFEALSDANRLAIVEILAGGEKCVCEVSGSLGISNALASHHLKKLREAGVVSTRRKGAWLYCRLHDDAIARVAEELHGLIARDQASSAGNLSDSHVAAGDFDD